MDQTLKLSIIMATYNRADTLRRTLDHLVKQNFDPRMFEVIVIDDGSSDDTKQVVEEMTPVVPFELAYLRHENRGPGYTQNRGIRKARGQLLLLMADDIFLSPNAVQEHIEFHDKNPEPEVAVLGKVVQSPDLNQSIFLKKWDPFRFSDLDGREELPPYWFGAANLSIKRDFMLRYGMFREQRGRAGAAALEDLELGYRLQKHGLRLHYTKEAWGYHYHLATLDQAIRRWYERGLNYGEFRSVAPHPELTVYFHVLNFQTLGDHIRVLRGTNSFRGVERSLAWHIIRHIGRVITLNRLTSRWVWRPVLDWAETNSWLAALMNRQIYRAFLYYHFIRGVSDGRKLYGF